MNALEFHDLTVAYSGRPVLDSVSGAIPAGRLTALIGPNGAGKSTLLRALARLTAYSGTVTFMPPDDEWAEARAVLPIPTDSRTLSRRSLALVVAVVSQLKGATTNFTSWELLSMSRLPHRGLFEAERKEDDEILIAAARTFGVESFLFRSTATLSGGEAQRVSLAACEAQRTPIMLLDEPTSALDPGQAARAFAALRRLARTGRTIVTVVHDVNLAFRFAQGVIALRDGKIAAALPVTAVDDELLERLYDVPFEKYTRESAQNSPEGNDVIWQVSMES